MANLDALVKELKQERDRLDKAIVALTSLERKSGRSGTRTMSAAARQRIAAAQRARWATQRSAAQNTPSTARAKRRISAAGLARIRAAAKARWAKVRAEKKK